MQLLKIWPEDMEKLFSVEVTANDITEDSLIFRKCLEHGITKHEYQLLRATALHDAALKYCEGLTGSVSVDISELQITPVFKYKCLACYREVIKARSKELTKILQMPKVRERNRSINRWIQRYDDEPLLEYLELSQEMFRNAGRANSFKFKVRLLFRKIRYFFEV